MIHFVELPSLPKNSETLIIGEKYKELLEKPLEKAEVSPLFVPNNPSVDCRLSGHADLSAFHAGGKRLFLAPYLRGSGLEKRLLDFGAEISFPELRQEQKYPYDAALNACSAGKWLIYCEKVTAREIVYYFTIAGDVKLISSRQGYAGCSVCIVDADSIITSDAGIAKSAKAQGLEVLQIRCGYIELPGFDYGFLGGAAFKVAEKTLAFTGRLDMHPDRDLILGFLSKHDIEPLFLTDENIFDIGGGIPLTEKQLRK